MIGKDTSFILSLKEIKGYWLKQPDKTPEEIVDGVLFSLFVMIDGDSATNNFRRLRIIEATTGSEITTGNLHDLYCKLTKDSFFKDKEISVLDRILTLLKVEDVTLRYVDNRLVAKDHESTWEEADFYRFLSEEVFVFNDDGSVLGIPNDLLEDFKKLAAKYNVTVKDNRVKEPYKGHIDPEELRLSDNLL